MELNKTNYDVLISLTPKDLEIVLYRLMCGMLCDICPHLKHCFDDPPKCDEAIRMWLEQPYDGTDDFVNP